MPIPKTLLVPTDFGPASDHAVAYAADLAEALGAELVLMHAWEIPALGVPDGIFVASTELVKQTQEAAQEGLARAMEPLRHRSIRVRALLQQGASSDAILACAADVAADLIVMSTHGRTGVTRALLGSVAESVLRSARAPVLTVHHPGVDGGA